MSELEKAEILTQVSNVTNIRDKRKLIPATRFATKKERESLETERNRIKSQLEYRGPGSASPDQKRDMLKYRDHLEDRIENETPPPLTADQKDVLSKREQELAGFIREGMLSREEFRRNDVGSVDRHIKWERRAKQAILEWKNVRRALSPESDEQDLANVEQLRPSLATSGVQASSTFMPEAQIPGHFAMTGLAKQNWPEGMTEYPPSSPLMQAQAREIDELKAALAAINERIAEDDAKKKKHHEKMMKGLKAHQEKQRIADEKKMQKEVDRLKAQAAQQQDDQAASG